MAAVDDTVEEWKVRNLIKKLASYKGNGTNMISLLMSHKCTLGHWSRLLTDEYSQASNIKSRVNKLQVLSAITSTREKLKTYSKMPENGLCIFCGTVTTDDGKEKKLTFTFEPTKPMAVRMYHCDNKFHVDPLQDMVDQKNSYGFIVIDGNGCLFGTLTGNAKHIQHQFSVDLPKKHGRGGQSAVRFSRLRTEARQAFVKKASEAAKQQFIRGNKPTVTGIILAGSANFKEELKKAETFDYRLKKLVLCLVDVSYGGENGFNQAIQLCQDTLEEVKFVKEKRILTAYMSEVARDTGKYCFGVKQTLEAFEQGAIDRFIVWDNLDIDKYHVKNSETGEMDHIFLAPWQAKQDDAFVCKKTKAILEVVEKEPLIEWIAENYKSQNAILELVTDKSTAGLQFVKGFGGIGGMLRYQCAFHDSDDYDDEDGDSDWI
jgi:peptide chain release factor subunit 1